MFGADFNARVGGLQPGDDVTLVGRSGCGLRNARGRTLVSWVLENGFQILSRQSDMEDVAGSWTCRSYFDDAKVQLEFLIGDMLTFWPHIACAPKRAASGHAGAKSKVKVIGYMRAHTTANWMDNSLPIELDHRCVHCLLVWEVARHEKQSARAETTPT